MAAGFALGRSLYRDKKRISTEMTDAYLNIIANWIKSSNKSQRLCAMTSLCEMGRYYPTISMHTQWQSVFDSLERLLTPATETRVLHQAITTLTHCTFMSLQDRDKVIQSMCGLAEKMYKEWDLEFLTGKCLSILTCGFRANCMKRYLDLTNNEGFLTPDTSTSPEPEGLKNVVNNLLDEYLVGKPGEMISKSAPARRCALVWMLCLTRHCGEEKSITVSLHLFLHYTYKYTHIYRHPLDVSKKGF
jgi:hypothetical protein